MYLSQAFAKEVTDGTPDLELKCIIYNINNDNNEDLKKKSGILYEYMYFINKVWYYIGKTRYLKEAINSAIDDCIHEGILVEFLTSRRDEVVNVTVLDFTWERRAELIKEQEWNDGHATGLSQGLTKGRDNTIIMMIKNKLLRGISDADIIADDLCLEVDEVNAYMAIINKENI